MATKIFDKVKDIIGDNVSVEVTALNDYINTAISEIADIAPTDIFLKYGGGMKMSLTESAPDADARGKKILSVTRTENGTTQPRDCMQVNQLDFETKYNNSGSTYNATNLTPVWSTVEELIKIAPSLGSGDTAKVYVFEYPDVDWVNSELTSINQFPPELEQAVIFRAGINIIQSYLSNSVQDDEDAEMQSMLVNQSQSLSTAYQQEIARYVKGGSS
jgi:hypothetical protein